MYILDFSKNSNNSPVHFALLIDSEFQIIHVAHTRGFHPEFKNQEYINLKCYYALWGREKPCEECPISENAPPFDSEIHPFVQYRPLRQLKEEALESIIPLPMNGKHYLLSLRLKEKTPETAEQLLATELSEEILADGVGKNDSKKLEDIRRIPEVKEYLEHLFTFHTYAARLNRFKLTPTEQEVALYILRNYPSKVIGQKLFITKKAVDFHRANIRKKLGITGQKITIGGFILSLNEDPTKN